MPIENRDLKPGTKLYAKYKKQLYHAHVVEGEEGKVLYRLENGREFKSPSAAGSAIMGGKACNGWRFWSVEESYSWAENPEEPDSDESEGEVQDEDTETESGDAEDDGAAEEGLKKFRRVPNQRGVEEGFVRLYCDACQMSFTAPSLEAEHCPEGHRPDGTQIEQESDAS